MLNELLAKLDMCFAVKTYLQVAANKTIWFNQPPPPSPLSKV